jgi:hypothetical protein
MAPAMAMPISPEIRKRMDKAVSGGMASTIILAEVKADDQIKAKTSPARSARKSMGSVDPDKKKGRCPAWARPFHESL